MTKPVDKQKIFRFGNFDINFHWGVSAYKGEISFTISVKKIDKDFYGFWIQTQFIRYYFYFNLAYRKS